MQGEKGKKYARLISVLAAFSTCTFVASSCVDDSGRGVRQVGEVVDAVKRQYAPDTRLDLFDVRATGSRSGIVVIGEVGDVRFHQAVLDSLEAAFEYTIIDSIRVLPAADILPYRYGIVYVSVAQMRREPRDRAELVSQTLMGTVLTLFKKEDGFYYAQNCDRYLGWVSSASMVEVDSSSAARWQQAPHVICVATHALVREQMDQRSTIVTDLVAGALMVELNQFGNWLHIEIPDGRQGYVEKSHVMEEELLRQVLPTRARIIETAKSYLGIPYLWGGTSTKGFDCSGLTQTVYRMNNVNLPRDTNQMVLEGEQIEAGEDFGALLPGDLLFFGAKTGGVSHVAIYIGDRQYIHADGWVHKNSFDPEHPLYNKYRHDRYKTARRILHE